MLALNSSARFHSAYWVVLSEWLFFAEVFAGTLRCVLDGALPPSAEWHCHWLGSIFGRQVAIAYCFVRDMTHSKCLFEKRSNGWACDN